MLCNISLLTTKLAVALGQCYCWWFPKICLNYRVVDPDWFFTDPDGAIFAQSGSGSGSKLKQNFRRQFPSQIHNHNPQPLLKISKIYIVFVQVSGGAICDMETKAGYTPLHVAAHFGQVGWLSTFLLSYFFLQEITGTALVAPFSLY
jgi:hypothetical protein